MNIRRLLIAGTAVIAVGAISGTAMGVAAAASPAAAGEIVVIDATTNKDAAVDALKLYQNATDRSFTPTVQPTFQQTDFKPVTDETGTAIPSVSGNAKTGQKGEQILSVQHEETSSWSLGGSIEGSVGFDLAGVVDAELSAKVTANHTWESNYTDKQDIWVVADPGKTVWIEAASGTATYTGDFAFTSNGIHYAINNVSITQPASAVGGPSTNTTYKVMQVDSLTAGLPADTTGGIKDVSTLPALQHYISDGH